MPERTPPGIPPLGGAVADVVVELDPRLRELVAPDAALSRLVDGCTWAEGPVYLPADGSVLFSDIPNDRAMRWFPGEGGRVVRQPNDYTNGNTLDREGRVIHCEHGERRVSRTEHDGTRHGLVDRFAGGRLNSPNDVVVASDGAIWFTDPPYGILSDYEGHAAPSEQAACYVFRFDPLSGDLSAVSDDLAHPNGLAFSPDERLLYVADSSAAVDPDGNHHILVFDVVEGRYLERPRPFAVIEPGVPDGMRVDEHGNVWTSALDGIHVLDQAGTELGRVLVPERTGNCVFGGPDGRRLFIAASSSLYAIDVLVRGAGVAATVARGEQVGGTA
jgi:gluconolactonase